MKDADYRGWVRGFTWKARMFNGAVFQWWTPRDLCRVEARRELFAIANASCADDNPAYEKGDIDSMWVTKGGK